jgi:nitrogen fixation NifU-like protein
MSLRELYQEMIVDHGREPRNFGVLAQANHCQAGHNPLCGDKLTVYILEQNGMIADLSFEGVGCAISVASASLMTEAVKGKTLSEIEKIFTNFHHLVTQGIHLEDSMDKLSVFSGVAEFPARVKCATLAWHTLKAALNNDPRPISTE